MVASVTHFIYSLPVTNVGRGRRRDGTLILCRDWSETCSGLAPGKQFFPMSHVLLQDQSWALTISNKKPHKGRDTGT